MSEIDLLPNKRHVVVVPSELASDMRDAAKQIGNPSIAKFTAMALRRTLRQIKMGKLANVNGELQSVGAAD
ncbi:MAG: hypothetical protein JWL59_3659 [Chthoniobacteraceae bacterium]|nr:hypothetical protein [Chthoniobacteraceae bacterium]